MELPKIKVKEGQKEEFERRALAMHKIAHGKLGWSGVSELMADMKCDMAILGYKVKGNARKRRKHYKKVLKQVMLRNLFETCEVIK